MLIALCFASVCFKCLLIMEVKDKYGIWNITDNRYRLVGK